MGARLGRRPLSQSEDKTGMKNKIYGEKPIDIVVKQLDNLGVSKWKINHVDKNSYQL